ncbi:hypothetical protein [Streptomyces sp. NPDC008125]|uniref:hypothetical protein n=1 Tax=Streptomyces sp. NPDC008125 TaxID=3364811 RepID=UPI0036F100BC
MPSEIKGTSRLIIRKFLHDWHNWEHMLLVYAARGHEGMGLVGTMPDHEGHVPDLWSIAARHSSPTSSVEEIGRWCLSSGWASTNAPADMRLTVEECDWTFSVRNTLSEIRPHQYGNTAYGWRGGYFGTVHIENADVVAQAHALMRT